MTLLTLLNSHATSGLISLPYSIVFVTMFQQGNTALHLSVIGNYRDLTRALVEANAEIDLQNHVSNQTAGPNPSRPLHSVFCKDFYTYCLSQYICTTTI